jgi:hypothetical protein
MIPIKMLAILPWVVPKRVIIRLKLDVGAISGRYLMRNKSIIEK